MISAAILIFVVKHFGGYGGGIEREEVVVTGGVTLSSTWHWSVLQENRKRLLREQRKLLVAYRISV